MISVVIITLNEDTHIGDCIKSVQHLTDDIIVVDAESSDRTKTIAEKVGAKVYSKKWEGYGNARNYGATLAQYHWIFALDADERATPQLVKALAGLSLSDHDLKYLCKRRNQYRGRFMRFGFLGPEWKDRLYHRNFFQWDQRSVHEQLSPDAIKTTKLDGEIEHYAYNSYEELKSKLIHYAVLFRKDKGRNDPMSFVKYYLSPLFHFIRTYIFRLGFLEGARGWETSKAVFNYTREKYRP